VLLAFRGLWTAWQGWSLGLARRGVDTRYPLCKRRCAAFCGRGRAFGPGHPPYGSRDAAPQTVDHMSAHLCARGALMPSLSEGKRLRSIKGAAEALSLSSTTIYTLLSARKLRGVKSGDRTLIPVASLDAYIATLQEGTYAPPRPKRGRRK